MNVDENASHFPVDKDDAENCAETAKEAPVVAVNAILENDDMDDAANAKGKDSPENANEDPVVDMYNDDVGVEVKKDECSKEFAMNADENATQFPFDMDDAANNETPVTDVANDVLVVDNGIEVGKSAMVNDIPVLFDDVVGVECNEFPKVMNHDVVEPSHNDTSVNDPQPSGKDAALPNFQKDMLSEVASIKSKVQYIENSVGVVDVSHLLHQVSVLKERICFVENVLGVKFEENLVANDDKSVDGHMKVRKCIQSFIHLIYIFYFFIQFFLLT